MTGHRFLGIDVGGTNTKVVLLDAVAGAPAVLASTSVPTLASDEPSAAIARLAEQALALAADHGGVAAAGVGVPGLFDATGSLVLLPNFPPAWRGVPLRQLMSQGLGLPTVLINDARSFTLAEARLGAAAGLATVVCVTLGTGVGGGIVIDGQLRAGPQGRAGEIGHQVIDPEGPPCGCGNRGCVESFVSAAAVCRAGGCDTVESVFRAAAAGDPRAAAALAGMVEHLAVGIANLVTVLRPDGVVVGGGVAAAGEALLAPLRTAVAARSPLVDPSSYTVVAAVLGPTAGAVGAALWAQEQNDAVLV